MSTFLRINMLPFSVNAAFKKSKFAGSEIADSRWQNWSVARRRFDIYYPGRKDDEGKMAPFFTIQVGTAAVNVGGDRRKSMTLL